MEELRNAFLAAILAGDLAGALTIAQQVRPRGLPFLYEELIGWTLVEVGRLWQQGELSVADEHIATAIAQSVLASFYSSFPWTTTGPKGIIACVQDERHELGARMAADLLAYDGWNITYLGGDTPHHAIAEIVARLRPVFVGLSFAMPHRFPSVQECIALLRQASSDVKLLLGGYAVATDSTWVQGLDVDAIAHSAASAMELIRSWKP